MVRMIKTNKKERMISAKGIIRKYNISYQAVNHYTDFGLLPISAKRGNVRFYDKSLVNKRLLQIRSLAKEGYSLRLIRKRLVGI
ncbi:MAG: MerR family transcriptional regulator [Candidatus Omnitrophica bacterium]|nr:MerR family transcriptional regulator [Candidatus Omnitrophota bacterium]